MARAPVMLLLFLAATMAVAEPDDDDDEVIVVTGLGLEEDAADAVHHTRVISGDDMRASGAQTVADALETQAGVVVVDGIGGTGVRIQGLDPEHTLILVDGVRVGGRVGGTLDLRRFNVADVEQIEIVEGPAATLYGSDAMAGVVHIRTRRPSGGTSAEVSTTIGRWAAPSRTTDLSVARAIPVRALDSLDLHAAVTGATERLRSRVQVEWHGSEATDSSPDTPSTDQNAMRQARISGTTDFRPTERHLWSLQADWQSFRRWGVDSLPTGATLDRTNLTSSFGVTGGPRIELSDRQRIEVVGGIRGWDDQYRADQRGSDTQDAYQRTKDLLGQVRARFDTIIGDRHRLIVGTEALGERLEADRIDPKRVLRSRFAAVLQDQWDPLGDDSIAVDAAVRGDVDSLFGQYLTPRLGLRVTPTPNLQLRLSGGRGFRAPDFRELYLVFENTASGYRVDGSEDLRPETSWNLQGGVSLQPGDGAELALRAFANELKNLIQADLVGGGSAGEVQRFAYVNIASARTLGGELEAALSHVDTGSVRLTYRFTDSLDRTSGAPLPGRARHQVNATSTLLLPWWSGQILVRGGLQGPRTFTESVDDEWVITKTPSALQLDLSLTTQPTERHRLTVGVENLANAGADPSSLLQTRPRRVFIAWTGTIGDPQ